MSRIARYRTDYLLVLGALSALTYTVVRAAGGSSAALLTVGFLLLVPGRLQGLLLRPLFRGQRALAEGKPEEAAVQFHHQLTQLQAQPWRRLALWLGWSPHTPSLAAMVTNNLGVAYAALGELEQAQTAWKHALALDHLYPVPYANLAAAAAARGASDEVHSLLCQARKLGYGGGPLDQATHRMQQLLAAVESRGTAL
ncbi:MULTISPECIES: tetratricopeptide repeat protein [Xanthomonas]|uniref:Tetratricopeptide (TPR) repeat protein n=1 Tax=Xanthomonas arboricola TaxID=56448 RepID=A0AB73GYK0_9XANT|nr:MULTISPECIES: tetratricopeptide repeat protein [Xanthomonas]MBB3797163.1 tetratricopeptide (TPR) repeat protein [Xanthomonas arboricola]MBB4767753.1 tetratricopeptide (TPR) repeat protein [Xanthomonas arboricola]MBB5671076.1 tetratricopeptide (TPR) repeat protein [Xanthomonas arboricola]